MRLVLEGRIAGLWAEELDRIWAETAPVLGSGKLTIDVRDVTYADVYGKIVLTKIFSSSDAQFVAGTLFTNDLVEEIIRRASKA